MQLATKLEVNVPSVFQLKLTRDHFFYCLESIIPLPFCNSFSLVYKPPRKYTMIISTHAISITQVRNFGIDVATSSYTPEFTVL